MSQPQPQPHEDYRNEPTKRSTHLIVNCEAPFNAEPPTKDLVKNGFITPENLFLARNHGPIPLYTNLDNYTLVVDGMVKQKLQLSLHELRTQFPYVRVVSTIQCAGNRRNDYARDGRKVKGVGWEAGAISTGVWGGVHLRDVLNRAGVCEGALHVIFEGDDNCHEHQFQRDFYFKYGASIPIHKAMDPIGDVLLAYEMNGEVLSRDRGYPLRVVVPGHIGARSVKWLRHITVHNEESQHFHQQRDYKHFPASVDWHNVESMWKSAPSIQEFNVQSVISEPVSGSNPGHACTIRGYALSGGGRRIIRVELSFDDTKTWVLATIKRLQDYGDTPRNYAWVFFEYYAKGLPSPCTITSRACKFEC